MLRVVAGAEHPAVDQPGRWRHLGEDRRRTRLAGDVEDPGQELGPFPRRAPPPFLAQERAPLRSGQVLLNEGKYLAFLVCQVIQHDSRQQLDECRQLTAAAQRGVHARERGRDMPVLLHHGVDRCQVTGIGELCSEHRPQVVVLGRVMVIELSPEGVPAGQHGRRRAAEPSSCAAAPRSRDRSRRNAACKARLKLTSAGASAWPGPRRAPKPITAPMTSTAPVTEARTQRPRLATTPDTSSPAVTGLDIVGRRYYAAAARDHQRRLV